LQSAIIIASLLLLLLVCLFVLSTQNMAQIYLFFVASICCYASTAQLARLLACLLATIPNDADNESTNKVPL